MIAPQVPLPDEVTEGWWDATREHRLVVQSCSACEGVQHPPRALCIHCGAIDRLEWAETTGRGVVDSFSVVYRAPAPEIEVPYVIARVRLVEGPILLTRLEGHEIDRWTIDDPVNVSWVDLEDGRSLPVFVPAEAQTREA